MRTDGNASGGEPRQPAKRRWVWLLLGVAVLAGGAYAGWYYLARVTVDDVRARYRERFAELRAKMQRIEANLPPVGSVKGETFPTNLDPKPVEGFDHFEGNTAEVMAASGEVTGRSGQSTGVFTQSSFRFVGSLREMQEGTEPNRRTAPPDLADEYERALAVKYLLVYRVVRFEPVKVADPAIGGEPTFSGGELDLEVFLVDLATEKPLGALRQAFQPNPKVLVTARKGKIDTSSAANTIYDSLHRDVVIKVHLALDNAAGKKSK